MVSPPEPPTAAKPHISQLGLSPQIFSPPETTEIPSASGSPILPTTYTSFHSSSCLQTPITTSLVQIETEEEEED